MLRNRGAPAVTALPPDAVLREEGLTAARHGRVLIVACGALAHEIVALREVNGWGHLDLACLPAILHNRPERIPAAVEEVVERHRGRYARMFLAYADCGTGGALERTCERLGIEMMRGPHCYAFFDGVERFEARGEVTSFFLTDFLVRQFDAFVWRPLGLDRHPDLRDVYFGNYRRLVYLAQTDNPGLDTMARDHADRLGLVYERRMTGFGELAEALGRL